jgi:hypothetical protein
MSELIERSVCSADIAEELVIMLVIGIVPFDRKTMGHTGLDYRQQRQSIMPVTANPAGQRPAIS